MSLLIITSTTFLGAIVLLAMLKPKKLHVRVEPMKMKVMGINIMPIIITVYNLMPAWMRKKSITKKVKIIKPINIFYSRKPIEGLDIMS